MSLPVSVGVAGVLSIPLRESCGLIFILLIYLILHRSRQFYCFTIAWGGFLCLLFVTDLVKICFVRSSCAKVVRFLIEPLIPLR